MRFGHAGLNLAMLTVVLATATACSHESHEATGRTGPATLLDVARPNALAVVAPATVILAATDAAAPATSDAAVAPIATPPSVEYRMVGRNGVRNAAGLRVEFLANGHVTLRGTDQWHHPLTANYESATYFRNAVPVLARTVTPAQAAALQQIVGELQPVPTPAAN